MNKLRIHFFPIVLFCCFIATNATTPTKNQKIKQIEGSLYIIENNRAIKVNNHVITVRLSVNTTNWANGVYIIRAGYNHNIYTKKFTITH